MNNNLSISDRNAEDEAVTPRSSKETMSERFDKSYASVTEPELPHP
jgi:hypothetical protein